MIICRHCQKCKVNRPRGLCWSCYYRPGVRDLYPSTSKYAHRGVGNKTGVQSLPSAPTDTEPGSEERLAVLAERARQGVQLWHPDDRVTSANGGVTDVSIYAKKIQGFHMKSRKAILEDNN